MKKLQNCLYITKSNSYLRKERETIVVEQEHKKVLQIPAHSLSGLYCFGNVMLTPQLIGFCGEKKINLSLFTEYGRFLGRFEGHYSGNVLLRRAQYRLADNEVENVRVGKVIIGAKIANSRQILMREIRNYGQNNSLTQAIKQLADCLRRVELSENLEILRGIEGEAASIYFSSLKYLIHTDSFSFSGRVKRPPTDPVNALLSFTYTILAQECGSALSGVGLDPYVGFLHRDRPGRMSLALDILEEFRAWWADRFVLTLLNRKQLGSGDFKKEVSGAVRLTSEARKIYLTAFQAKKQEEILHPFLNEKVPIGLLPHCQALLLARHLRNDLEYYPPFVVK
ncbi:type I-C CRISPR-associated endonuclease Cas1c [Candidatus Riflebacteria bacterium]